MSDSPIKFIQVKCPNCNAVMNLENYRTTAFCSYCGTRLLIHSQNEQIIHTIDEAKIKQAEAERDVRVNQTNAAREIELKKLETQQQKSKNRLMVLKYVGIVIAFLFCMFFFGGYIEWIIGVVAAVLIAKFVLDYLKKNKKKESEEQNNPDNNEKRVF